MIFCYNIVQLVARFKKKGVKKGYASEEVEDAVNALKRAIGYSGNDEETSLTDAAISERTANGVSNGFDHALHYCISRKDGALRHQTMSWGLIPGHTNTVEAAKAIADKTLNARAESIFEKPSFKHSVMHRRCLLPLNGFFEHHHKGGKAIPHYITKRDADFYYLGCIFDEWQHPSLQTSIKTFSIVTVPANQMMATIHNAKKDDPRMPLALSGDDMLTWLDPHATKAQLMEIMKPAPNDSLIARTVKPLKGKNAAKNVDDAIKQFSYPELDVQQELF